MNILLSIVIVGLLQQYCAVQGFTVQMAQDDITGFEGDTLRPMVRLEGQLIGEVEVELQLLTVSEFLSSSNAPADVTFNDAAEPADFNFDGTLMHTFEPVDNIRQTTTFDIDIVNDDKYERVEDFVAVVTVTRIDSQFDFLQTSLNLRLFTTVTILIDPNAPDRSDTDSMKSNSEFIVGFTTNYMGNRALTLYVTTREVVPVPFVVETLLGFVFTGNATNNSTTIVQLNSSYQVHSSSDRNKGIRIYAGNKQITVHGLNYQFGSSDAFLALPCSTQRLSEYIYYGLTYADTSGRESQLLIVACEDNTTISVGFQTIFLNKMETYLLESTGDLTGTVAVSNNPISFFSGHQCTNVPTNVPYCDYLIEQLPDTSTWGTHFLSASFAGRDSGEIYRVLASQPSTTVTFTCSTLSQPSTYTLPSAGSWEEITTLDDSFCSIVSNNPVLLAQFALGSTIDGYGDPFMVVVPAIDQYINNYVVPLFHQFSTNFITIFVSPEHYQPQDIYVNDVSLEDSNWTVIYCPSNMACGYSAYVNLPAGDHRIYHTNKAATIGVIAYGFDDSVSYGFPAGFEIRGMQDIIVTCHSSGLIEVVITCENIELLVSLQCSFNGGPLHPCTLPLVITSDVSPVGNHSVRIVANNVNAEDTVPYIISDTAEPTVSPQVPSLRVYLINESPQVTSNSVEAEFQITRPVAGVRCFLRSELDRIWQNCSSGHILFPNLKPGLYVLKIQAFNRKTDVHTVKRGFEINSDPNYCSLVLVNRGVTVSEDGSSAEVDVQLYGPATQLSCVLDGGNSFTCVSPVELFGLATERHRLEISPLGCSGGSKTLSVLFTVPSVN